MRKIQASKLSLIVALSLCCVINLLLSFYFVDGIRTYTSQEIFVISWVAIIELIIIFTFWKRMTKELLSPFLLTVIATILFGMGQIFGWAFGLNMGYIDLQQYIPNIGMHYIGDGLLYTLDGIILFMLGGAFAYKGTLRSSIKLENTEKNELDKEAIRIVSTLLLFISVPSFIMNIWNILPSVLVGGYSELYTEINSYSQLEQLILLFAGWFPIALFMKYALYNKTKKTYATLAVVGIAIDVVLNLFIGGRSGAVMTVLAFIITKHYLGTPFSLKRIIPASLFGYLGIAVLNAVKEIRLMGNRSLFSILSVFSLSSVIGSFVAELGWSMSSLSWTMRLLENDSNYRYGETYLYALTAIIPNIGFWGEHPALKANLGIWLQTALGRTTGLGYTFIAETYANFAWGGLVVMFLFGYVLCKVMTLVTRDTAKYNFKVSIILIMMISILLKPFVRSSFSAIMRQLIFTVMLITILISVTSSIISKSKNGRKKLK